jgi:hypothetical protein
MQFARGERTLRGDFWGWGQVAPAEGRAITNRSVRLVGADPLSAELAVENDWTIDGEPVLREQMTVRAGEDRGARILDLTYRFTSDYDVTLNQMAFTGMCFRWDVRRRDAGQAGGGVAEELTEAMWGKASKIGSAKQLQGPRKILVGDRDDCRGRLRSCRRRRVRVADADARSGQLLDGLGQRTRTILQLDEQHLFHGEEVTRFLEPVSRLVAVRHEQPDGPLVASRFGRRQGEQVDAAVREVAAESCERADFVVQRQIELNRPHGILRQSGDHRVLDEWSVSVIH